MELQYLTIRSKLKAATPQEYVDTMEVRYRGRRVTYTVIPCDKSSYGMCYKVQFYYSAVQSFVFVLKVCNGKMKRSILEENLIGQRVKSMYVVPMKRMCQRAVAMPYYPLRLDALIADNRVHDYVKDVDSFVDGVRRGLADLRAANLWYLDLKPEHVALAANGGPVLLDLGAVVPDSHGMLPSTYPPPRYHKGLLPIKQLSQSYVRRWHEVQLQMLRLSVTHMSNRPFVPFTKDTEEYSKNVTYLEQSSPYKRLGRTIRHFEASFTKSLNNHNDVLAPALCSRSSAVSPSMAEANCTFSTCV